MRKNIQKRLVTPSSRLRSTKALQRKKIARGRKIETSERKLAILDSALTEFAERGFEAARLDDVAARAGIAKGTLYLYFDDKEGLFEEVVRCAVTPILEQLSALATAPDISADKALEKLFSLFEREILGTKRKLLIRLIMAEGPRFPRIAEFYYRNVIARIMPLLAKMAERAVERGEFSCNALARYPQLVAAPLLVAVIWDALFATIEPLDVADFFSAYREVLEGRTRRALP